MQPLMVVACARVAALKVCVTVVHACACVRARVCMCVLLLGASLMMDGVTVAYPTAPLRINKVAKLQRELC